MATPKLLTTPFAESGQKNDIPVTGGAEPNNATYFSGFPNETMIPIAEGGRPPSGKDFNGIFYDITDNVIFQTQGNSYPFNQAYANAIGGYPLHARLQLDNGDIVKSTIPNNTNNPNTNMSGWFSENRITTCDAIADLLLLEDMKNGDVVNVKGYYTPINFALAQPYSGGGERVYVESRALENDGFLCINGWVLQESFVTPKHAGAKADGTHDDTDAINKYVASFRYANMQNENWRITSKINIPSGRFINLGGSNLHAENGLDPIFEFQESGDGLYILHGGGVITGTADSFLKCSGSTNSPTSIGEYARQIRLEGVVASSETIDKFLDFQNAVRQVFMNKVHAYTKNGINAIGKCVEVKAQGCIIYGSTGESDTYGIKLRSPAGGAAYNEGFHFTDCTNDNFGITYDVTDIYAMSVTGGHSGCVAGGKVAVFGQPTSTACRDMKFTGVNLAGSIEFAPDGGRDYHAQFTGCVSEMCDGVNIHIKNNAASISVSDHRFHTSTNGLGIVCDNNNANIKMNDLTFDTTFISGVQVKGAFGENCSLRDVSYSGTGDSIYLERPILLSGIPVDSSAIANYLQVFNTSNLQGSYAVGSTIASVSHWFAKGEIGEIICELSYSGANTVTQRLDVTVPDGMVIPSGTGWNSRFIMTNAVSGVMSIKIPYYVTSDISGQSVSISNGAGNAIIIDYHSYFGFKRNS